METIRKVTPDPDEHRAIHEEEPDLQKLDPDKMARVDTPANRPQDAPQPPRTARGASEIGSGSLTPVPQLPGRYGLRRPITGQTSPTGEDQ